MLKIHERKVLIILLLAWSFLLQLLFALLTGPPNFWEHYTGTKYLDFAESMVEGRGYPEPIRAVPLYGLVLTGLLWLFDYASLPLLLLHIGFGLATTFFTYKIARSIFSPVIGLLAGLFISVHPYLVKLTMQIIDTGPSVAMTTFSMWLLVRAWLSPFFKPGRYALAGAAFALTTLVRPVAAAAVAVLGGGIFVWYVVRRNIRRAITVTAVLWLAWAAVMSPWWVRNYVRYGQFIALTAHGGLNLHKGHTAYYDRVHPVYDTDYFPYCDPIEVKGDDPSGALASKMHKQAAIKYIKEHPAKAILTDLRKIVWLYTWHKVPCSLANSKPHWDSTLNKVVDDGNPRPAFQDIVYSIYWIPMLLMFLSGIILSRHHWRKLIPIYLILFANALTVSLTFADTRYRLEVDPYIVMFAAYGVVGLLKRFGGKFSTHQFTLASLPEQET